MLTENQILDTATMEIRDKTPEEMAQKPEDSKTETKEDNESSSEETENPKAKKTEEPKKEDPKKEEAEEDESEEKEEEEEEEESTESSKEEEEKSESKSEEEVVEVNSFLAEKYAEQYGIKTESDLDEALEGLDGLEKQNEELKAKIEELEKAPAKIKFESEQEEKAFNFLKNYPIDRMGEGMQTFGKIITMDLKTADPKIILEEKFILENPELTRDEALKKFNRDYNKKYTVKAEEFDGDEAGLKEEQEMRAIDLKADVAKARDFLSKKQTELKSTSKAENKEQPKENEAVTSSIKTNMAEVDEYMKDFDSLIFSSDGENDEFTYKLTKDQKKLAQEALKGWVGNRNSYDAKGKLAGSKGLDEDIQNISFHLFGADMVEKALKHGLKKGEIKRADQIGKEKPIRTSKGSSGELKSLSEVDQWQQTVKEVKKGR